MGTYFAPQSHLESPDSFQTQGYCEDTTF